jgi:sec-independent protein translocase protein TatC
MSEEHDEQQEGLQMSFLDHLDELRKRLIQSVIGILVAFAVCFSFSYYIFKFLAAPIAVQMQKQKLIVQKKYGSPDPNQLKDGELLQYTITEETMVGSVKIPIGTTIQVKKTQVDGKQAFALAQKWGVGSTILPEGTTLPSIYTEGEKLLRYDTASNQLVLRSVTSSIMIYIQVALYAGIAFSIPFLFYQFWAFISPGLYKHEKKYLTPVLSMATVLFIGGAAFGYKVAFPAAADYLLGLAQEGGFQTLLDAEEYLNLIIMIMLGLGVVFQIPTISFVLGRIGLVTPKMMLKMWRYAVVLIMIVAAILTPTPDPWNMMIFAIPMIGLYFVSVGIVWLFGKPRRTDEEVRALAHNE